MTLDSKAPDHLAHLLLSGRRLVVAGYPGSGKNVLIQNILLHIPNAKRLCIVRPESLTNPLCQTLIVWTSGPALHPSKHLTTRTSLASLIDTLTPDVVAISETYPETVHQIARMAQSTRLCTVQPDNPRTPFGIITSAYMPDSTPTPVTSMLMKAGFSLITTKAQKRKATHPQQDKAGHAATTSAHPQ